MGTLTSPALARAVQSLTGEAELGTELVFEVEHPDNFIGVHSTDVEIKSQAHVQAFRERRMAQSPHPQTSRGKRGAC